MKNQPETSTSIRTNVIIRSILAIFTIAMLILVIKSDAYSGYVSKKEVGTLRIIHAFWGLVITFIAWAFCARKNSKFMRGIMWVGVLWFSGFVVSAYTEIDTKKEVKTVYSQKNEWKKEYQLVKYLRNEHEGTNAIDAYGKKLIPGNWYVRSTQALTLFPFSGLTSPDLSSRELDNAEFHQYMVAAGKVTIDSHSVIVGPMSNRGYIKVKVVLFNSKKIDVFQTANGVKCSIVNM